MKKTLIFLGILVLAAVITYFSGPKIPQPEYGTSLPQLPTDLSQLENYIQQREAKKPVRENNQARILWQQEVPEKTEYSVVYLHGFSGSWRDGYPVNVQLADTLEANLYLSRWAGHGLKPSAALQNFSPEAAWQSAKEALVIGNRIGKKVIIMSTSTGGTLALKLAATYPEMVYALINISPNVEDEFDGSFLLNSHWGYELAQLVSLGERHELEHEKKIASKYFDTVYPSSALVDLQVLLATTMNAQTFQQVECPVLTLFYYENFMEEDQHVEVEEYPEVHAQLGTPDSLKKLVRLEAPENHFMASDIKSKNTEVVLKAILEFLTETLRLDLDPSQAGLEDQENNSSSPPASSSKLQTSNT